MDTLIQIIWQTIMLPVGLIFGGMAERKHRRELDAREAGNRVRLDNRKHVADPETVLSSHMISGQVVIATDYWKSFVTKLRNLVGGEMGAAHAMMDRGRREALMRLRENAARQGAAEVWNVRLEFSNIAMMRGRQGAMQVEIFAYGTAVVRQPQATTAA